MAERALRQLQEAELAAGRRRDDARGRTVDDAADALRDRLELSRAAASRTGRTASRCNASTSRRPWDARRVAEVVDGRRRGFGAVDAAARGSAHRCRPTHAPRWRLVLPAPVLAGLSADELVGAGAERLWRSVSAAPPRSSARCVRLSRRRVRSGRPGGEQGQGVLGRGAGFCGVDRHGEPGSARRSRLS